MNIRHFIDETLTFDNIVFIIIGLLLFTFYIKIVGEALRDMGDQGKKRKRKKKEIEYM